MLKKRRFSLISATALLSAFESNAVALDEKYQTEETLEIRKSVFGLKSYIMNSFGLDDKSRFKAAKSYPETALKISASTDVDLLDLRNELSALKNELNFNGSHSVIDNRSSKVIVFKKTYLKKVKEAEESMDALMSILNKGEEE